MKQKVLSYLGASMMLFAVTNSSAQCLNVNGDMESFTGIPVAGNTWINDDLTNWSVSHGSPSIVTSPDMEMWMWSYYGRGEGIFTNYTFTSGQTYQISYDLWRDGTSNLSSEFRVELTTGLVPQYTTGTGIPTPASSQSLATQPWVSTGVWVTITETFVAGAGYNQVWLYPFLAGAPTPWQAACRVDNICITEVVTDPCAFEPEFITDYEEECMVNFTNVSVIPAGLTVLGTYWNFGDGTTGTGNTISHYYSTSGVYLVCMTVWVINKDGECCQLEYCREIDAPACDPCEWIRNVTIEVSGTNPITFSAGGLPSGMYGLLGYQLDFGDGSTGIGNPITHSYDAGGVYTVCLTVYYYDPASRACCSFRVCTEVEVADVADARPRIEEGIGFEAENIAIQPLTESVVISPNPNDGSFQLSTKDGSPIESITVYDPAGKIVFLSNYTSTSNRITINLTDLNKGMYIVVLNELTEQNKLFTKLIIN